METLQTLHGRFVHFRDLGINVGVRGDLEVAASIYYDADTGEWLRVEIMHDPSRQNLGRDVPFLTRLLRANLNGVAIGDDALLQCPCATQEEILGAFAGVPNYEAPVWSQRSEVQS